LEELSEETLLDTLVARLEGPQGRQEYQVSFGLCYPHYHTLLNRGLSEPVRQVLVETQRQRTEELIGNLRGFLAKNSVQEKWNRTREENRAPRRALLKTGGNEGV
jgi:hypothetical protein